MTDDTDILAGLNATRTVRQLVEIARAGGLRPGADPALRRRMYRVYLAAGGTDGLFGTLYVSAARGVLVRAVLMRGNDDAGTRYEGAGAAARVRAVLTEWKKARDGQAPEA